MSIIDGRQKRKWKVIELIATFFGWLVILFLALQIIASVFLWIFNVGYIYNELFLIGNIEDTVFIFSVTILVAILAFTLLYFWGNYNYRKFGNLRRRRFPDNVSTEELTEHFNLPVESIKKMQSEKYILLEKNII